MLEQQADYGFTINTESGRNIFIYNQEKYNISHLLPLIIAIPIPAFLLTLAFDPYTLFTGGLVWLLLCIGSFVLIKYFMNFGRKERSFIIDDKVFEVAGQRYLRADINAIYVQEGKTASLPDVRPNYGAVNTRHATSQLVGEVGETFHKNKDRINCSIIFRYGNRNVTLANGITKDTAELILGKINNL